MTNKKLVLCYTKVKQNKMLRDITTDHYEIFDTFDKTMDRYEILIKENDTYCASICSPIVSTEPHYTGEK